MSKIKQKYIYPNVLVAIFLLLSTSIGFIGYKNYLAQKQNIKYHIENQLLSVGELKISQINYWLKERRDDANVIKDFLSSDPEMLNNISILDTAQTNDKLLKFLFSLKFRYGFHDIYLLRNSKEALVNLSDKMSELSSIESELVDKALMTKDVVLSDFIFLDGDGVYLDFVIPLSFENDDSLDNLFSFAVLIRCDVERDFYPMLRNLSILPTRSSESYLVKFSGQEITYLSRLENSAKITLGSSQTVSDTSRVEYKSMHHGSGIYEGYDYRGVYVLSYIGEITGTPWRLVSKVDHAEIFKPISEMSQNIFAVVILLILICALMIELLWRYQREGFYKNQYESEAKRLLLVRHYEFLTKYANDIILLSNRNGDIIDANDRALNVYGYDRETLLKMNINDLRSPSARDQFSSFDSELVKQGGIVLEAEHIRKNRTAFPVEVSARYIDIDGALYLQEIIRDITYRKKIEDNLILLNRLYRILSNVDKAIVRSTTREGLFGKVCDILHYDGHFPMAWVGIVDEATKRINMSAFCGYDKDYFNGLTITADDSVYGLGPTGTCVRTQKHVICPDMEKAEYMEPWIQKSRKYNYHSIGAFPLIVNGNAVGALTILSNRKGFYAEEEVALIAELADELSFAMLKMENEEKRLSAENLLKHSEAHLRQKQKIESVGILASGIAHEINNPLTGVINYAQLINDDTEPESAVHNFAKEIIGEGERISGIIKNLMSYSRMDKQGKSVASIQDIMDNTLTLITKSLQKDSIKLNLDIPRDLPAIMCRTQQIQQVLMTVILNAKDALNARYKDEDPNKIMTIKVVRTLQKGKEYIKLLFIDMGCGIPPELMKNLFTPFFTTKPKDKNTGLGLFISLGIIKDHGGDIEIESSVNEFTKVTVSLPTHNKTD